MSGVNIEYKGESIATIPATGSKTIKTQGKYCEGDILVEYEAPPTPTPTLISKQISENGTYTAADDNADGYSDVTVAVPSGGEYIHTRDIVLDEDVVEIAIEVSESTIAAYFVCNLPIIRGSGTNEYIYPHYQGRNRADYIDTSLNFTGVGSFVICNDSTCFFLSNTAATQALRRGAGVVDTQAIRKKILLELYYANSVFATGGTIQIYECFGKGT